MNLRQPFGPDAIHMHVDVGNENAFVVVSLTNDDLNLPDSPTIGRQRFGLICIVSIARTEISLNLIYAHSYLSEHMCGA